MTTCFRSFFGGNRGQQKTISKLSNPYLVNQSRRKKGGGRGQIAPLPPDCFNIQLQVAPDGRLVAVVIFSNNFTVSFKNRFLKETECFFENVTTETKLLSVCFI